MVVLSLPGELLKRWASSDDFVRLSAGTSLLFVNHGYYALYGAFQVVPLIKNLPGNARVFKDAGSVRGLGISPGGGRGNPLQYSCLENPMDGGAWWAHDWSDLARTDVLWFPHEMKKWLKRNCWPSASSVVTRRRQHLRLNFHVKQGQWKERNSKLEIPHSHCILVFTMIL